jgi:hypothetical protein
MTDYSDPGRGGAVVLFPLRPGYIFDPKNLLADSLSSF